MNHSVTVGANYGKVIERSLNLSGCIREREAMVDLAEPIAKTPVAITEVESAHFTSEVTCGPQHRALLSFDQSAFPFTN